MAARSAEPKLIFPGLAGFYSSMLPVAATLVRVVVGNNYGLPMPGLFAYTAMGMELIGGACLIIGLFTRFWAAALAVEIGIALIVAHLPKGYSIGAGGYEYVLLIGVVLLTIAM